MEQQRTSTNEQPERVECPSCLLRLSLLQAQVEKVEKLLYCIKDTLNFKEACRYTGLSDSQLYKLTKTGKVPHYKPSGKLLFFSKRELDGWLCRNHECGELPTLDERNSSSNSKPFIPGIFKSVSNRLYSFWRIISISSAASVQVSQCIPSWEYISFSIRSNTSSLSMATTSWNLLL